MTGPKQWGPLLVGNHQRRQDVRLHGHTGLDTVEVFSEAGEAVLRLGFLGRTPTDVTERNVRIVAPPGSPKVRALSVFRRDADEIDTAHLSVRLDRAGGAGTYRLRLVEPEDDDRTGHRPKRGVDPRFAEVAFTFDTQRPVQLPPPQPFFDRDDADAPNTYLARDYAGLRQLMLDRLAVTLPADAERNPADLTVTLIELFAYLADELSYSQDDAATEAYLETARRRISVRRHARLVDYHLHEGCHARGWVCLEVQARVSVPGDGVRFVTAGTTTRTPTVTARELAAAPGGAEPTVFSGLPATAFDGGSTPDLELVPAHNCIPLWNFGEHDAVLRAGACSATLADGPPADGWDTDDRPDARQVHAGRVLELAVGDVLVLEAITDGSGLGPADDGDRHAVRITRLHRRLDMLYGQAIVEVHWAAADALPFELPISVGAADGTRRTAAHARGNAVLVGHGQPVREVLDAIHPVLEQPGLTFGTAFPDDDSLARHQARRLRRLLDDLRSELTAWRDITAFGIALGDAELSLLRQLYSRDLLESVGMPRGSSVEDAWNQSGALTYLVDHAERYFADRAHRARELARQCEAHGPLSTILLAELTETWGSALAGPLDPAGAAAWGSASAALRQSARDAAPFVSLAPVPDGDEPPDPAWYPVADMLDGFVAERFVVEVDDRRRARVRLDARAEPPVSGRFDATYWIGNGRAGNVPPESIAALLVDGDTAPALMTAVRRVRNPLPTSGGTDPEDLAAARWAIPGSFREHQPRGLSADGYAAVAAGLPEVARAAAEQRFDGRRVLIDVCVEQGGAVMPTMAFLREVRHELSAVRRIGHDLRVSAPRYRPLRLAVIVWVHASIDEQDAVRRVTRLLGSATTHDGEPALFHRSRFGFGQPVWASPIVAAIRALPGIVDVELSTFGFLDEVRVPVSPPEVLAVAGLEIARLDNDVDHPERGVARVRVRRSS